jgi:hypothetical protein
MSTQPLPPPAIPCPTSSWIGHAVPVILILLAANGIAFLGYAVISRRCLVFARRQAGDILGHTAGIACVINAVLFAFIVFAAWTYYDKARDAVDRETGTIWQIWNDIEVSEHPGLREPGHLLGDRVREYVAGRLQRYVRFVADKEWKEVARGRGWETVGVDSGMTYLREAYQAVLESQQEQGASRGKANAALASEIVKRFNSVFEARQERIALGEEGAIQWIVWVALIGGGLLSLASVCVLGFESPKLHAGTVFMLATSLGLIVVVIVALNTPFKGIAPILPTRFCKLASEMNAWEIHEAQMREAALRNSH